MSIQEQKTHSHNWIETHQQTQIEEKQKTEKDNFVLDSNEINCKKLRAFAD